MGYTVKARYYFSVATYPACASRTGGTTSYFVQQLASPNEDGASDTQRSTSYGTAWSQLYYNLADLNILIGQAEELGAPHYTGPARVMKAYNLGLLVNMFGDVPYSEAFDQSNLQPVYDSSESVYNAIMEELSTALTDMNAEESAAVPGEDDMIYGGDLAAWTRTAYALQARFLNHLSKLPSYDPQAVLTAVDNAFASNDEDFEMGFFEGSGSDAENPWYRLAVNNAGLLLGGWLSEQVITHLDGTIYGVFDPRIELITEPVQVESHPHFGEYLGTPNGAGRGTDPASEVRAVLVPGEQFYYSATPTQVVQNSTFAEMKFIEAEAALALGNSSRAYQAYETGIRAHMEKMGVAPEDIETYWNEPVVSVGASNLTIDEIMKEKYVALFLNPEVWNDARRYDYSYADFDLPANLSSDTEGDFLRTVRPPDTEVQRNSANIPSMSLQQRVFWDVQ